MRVSHRVRSKFCVFLCDGAILRAAVWDSLILSNAESSASVRSAGLPPPLPPRPPRSPGTPRAASAALRSPPRPPSAPPRWTAAGPSAYSSARSRTDPERSERRKAENVRWNFTVFIFLPLTSRRLVSTEFYGVFLARHHSVTYMETNNTIWATGQWKEH